MGWAVAWNGGLLLRAGKDRWVEGRGASFAHRTHSSLRWSLHSALALIRSNQHLHLLGVWCPHFPYATCHALDSLPFMRFTAWVMLESLVMLSMGCSLLHLRTVRPKPITGLSRFGKKVLTPHVCNCIANGCRPLVCLFWCPPPTRPCSKPCVRTQIFAFSCSAVHSP